MPIVHNGRKRISSVNGVVEIGIYLLKFILDSSPTIYVTSKKKIKYLNLSLEIVKPHTKILWEYPTILVLERSLSITSKV